MRDSVATAVICAVVLVLVIVFAFGVSLGSCTTARAMLAAYRAEAVDQGRAEWVVIDSDGTTEFRWKEAE